MTRVPKQYDREFKIEAVRLLETSIKSWCSPENVDTK